MNDFKEKDRQEHGIVISDFTKPKEVTPYEAGVRDGKEVFEEVRYLLDSCRSDKPK